MLNNKYYNFVCANYDLSIDEDNNNMRLHSTEFCVIFHSRLGIMSGALYFSLTVSTAVSSYMFNALGYTLLFFLCASIAASGFFYTYVVIQETVTHIFTEVSLLHRIKKKCIRLFMLAARIFN